MFLGLLVIGRHLQLEPVRTGICYFSVNTKPYVMHVIDFL